MKSKCVRGERFFLEGKPWACLDVKGKRLLAIQMLNGDVRVLNRNDVRTTTGKAYLGLIKDIDSIQSRILPGSTIETDAGVVRITKVYRSGAAEGVNELGERCPVDRWVLMSRVAGTLVAQRPTQLSPSPTEPQPSAGVTPPPTNQTMAASLSNLRSGMVGQIWKRVLEAFWRRIRSRSRRTL